MRYNELIRPGGIGRKQVAFNTSVTPSELSAAEDVINNQTDTATIDDTIVGMSAIGEVAAYSAATATQNEVQNFCYELDSLKDFAFVGAAVPFQFDREIIKNPFISYDPRSQFFTLRKPGWYWVKMFVHFTGINGNYDWWLSLYPETANLSATVGELFPEYMAFNNVYKHCNLNGTALINIPQQIDGGVDARNRFGIKIGTTHTGLNTFTTANTKVGLQIIYLGALPISTRQTYNIV